MVFSKYLFQGVCSKGNVHKGVVLHLIGWITLRLRGLPSLVSKDAIKYGWFFSGSLYIYEIYLTYTSGCL